VFAAIGELAWRGVADYIQRKTAAAAFAVAALAALLFAFGFGLVALRDWLATLPGVAFPDAWIAGGLVVVAAPFVALSLRKQRQPPETQLADVTAIVAAPLALQAASRLMRPRLIGMAAFAAAGYLIVRRLERR